MNPLATLRTTRHETVGVLKCRIVIVNYLNVNRDVLVRVSLILHNVDGPDLLVKFFPS